MKERDVIYGVLKKYEMVAPISEEDKEKILLAKRRTLEKILVENGAVVPEPTVVSPVKRLLNGLEGMFSPLSGLQSGFAIMALSLFLIVGGSWLYFNKTDQLKSSRKVDVIALSTRASYGDVQVGNNAGGSSGKYGDTILPGATLSAPQSGALILGIKDRATIGLTENSSVKVKKSTSKATILDLEKGQILSKTVSPIAGVYRIETKDALVTVRGTIFSVSSRNDITSVAVLRGRVELKNRKTGEICEIPAGMVANSKAMKSEKKHGTALDVLSKFKNISESLGSNSQNRDFNSGKLKELNINGKKEHIKNRFPRTLKGIKAKYGMLSKVILYNGKTYRGSILSRGRFFHIVTTRGVVRVPAKNVKNVFFLKH